MTRRWIALGSAGAFTAPAVAVHPGLLKTFDSIIREVGALMTSGDRPSCEPTSTSKVCAPPCSRDFWQHSRWLLHETSVTETRGVRWRCLPHNRGVDCWNKNDGGSSRSSRITRHQRRQLPFGSHDRYRRLPGPAHAGRAAAPWPTDLAHPGSRWRTDGSLFVTPGGALVYRRCCGRLAGHRSTGRSHRVRLKPLVAQTAGKRSHIHGDGDEQGIFAYAGRPGQHTCEAGYAQYHLGAPQLLRSLPGKVFRSYGGL
jgi:hypothetical protein